MKKRIFLTGLTSSPLGGMEFHNLGNYIIMEPLVKLLKSELPNIEIYTTIQMTDDFYRKFKIHGLKNKRFWRYSRRYVLMMFIDGFKVFAYKFFKNFGLKFTGILNSSVYLKEINNSEVLLHFEGDIYGDNANNYAFIIESLRLWYGVLLGKKTAIIISSLGPFSKKWKLNIAKYLINKLDLVTLREPETTKILNSYNIKGNIHTVACPSVFFESHVNPKYKNNLADDLKSFERVGERPLVGFILTGWNMPVGPFNRWPREDWEFDVFIQFINFLIDEMKMRVCLMPHQNSTDHNMNLLPGNDHRIINKLLKLMNYRKDIDLFTLKHCYDASTSKYIIGKFDMLISGRIHGAVQGLSQTIPTLVMNYGHEPKAHKLKGFATIYGINEYLVAPDNLEQLMNKTNKLWNNRVNYVKNLNEMLINVKSNSLENFELLRSNLF